MKPISKRLLAIALSIVMLFGTLLMTACNSTDQEPVTEDTTTAQSAEDTTVPVGEEKEPTREDEEPSSDKDYSGTKVHIIARDGPAKCSLLQGNENDVQSISDSIAKRTMYIEEKYKVEMSVEGVGDTADYPKLQASYLGGDQLYDFIAPHPTNNIVPLMTSGMLQDLHDSAALGGYIDLTKLWWNQSQVEAFTIGDRLFVGSPDFNLNKRGVSLLVLNKETWDTVYPDENIYELIFDGKWTLDKMIDVLNENYDEEAGTYGYAGNNTNIHGFYIGAGGKYMVKDENNNWILQFDVDACSTFAEKMYSMLIGPQTFLEQYYYSGYPTSNVWKTFESGKALIHEMDIDYFGKMLAAVEFQTAYIPHPKLNEQQDKYYNNAGCGFMGIPNDAKDLELCGLLMESFNWYTYHNFRPIYIDSYLSVLIAKNENDYKIVEMALNNGVKDLCEFVDTSGLASTMFKEVVINNNSTDVASYIASYESFANGIIQGVLNDIRNAPTP